jgi:adenine-specific DNA-methyltransferase
MEPHWTDRRRRAYGRSRALRAEPTDAEALLWRRLRQGQFGGFRFRRQHPIGPYFADFACLSAGLVVELDGGQHTAEGDRRRTALIEAAGFRVIRFWNNEVLGNTEGVLAAIAQALGMEA